MSIVDNQKKRRIFAVIFLSAAAQLACAEMNTDWRTLVSGHLLDRWQQVAGTDSQASVSFPGLPASYQLAHCNHDLKIDPVKALQPGRNGIEVSCGSPYWKQHLAIQLHVFRDVAILTQAVASDAVISADDIRYVSRDTGELNQGFFTADDGLNGMIMRRSQRAGTVVSANMVEAPQVIERGDEVLIQVMRPGIRVEMKGTALESARAGERLRVRNNQSDKIVTARAVRAGLVQVR